MLNSAGCKQLYGDALTYRLANDSVLIVPSRLCLERERVLAKSGRVDVLRVCAGKQSRQDLSFIVDSAT
jgi:hypothetical protein